MTYFILKKYFKFLIDDYGFNISFKQRMGFVQITYTNKKIDICILGEETIRILISEAESYWYEDFTEYRDEFKTSGNYCKKAKAASQWLKEKLKKDYCL